MRAGRDVDCVIDSSGGEEHDTSQPNASLVREVPRSMGRDNFTVKLFLYISCESCKQNDVEGF